MIAQIRAEWLKQTTLRTGPALLGTMLALVVLAVVLHAEGLPTGMLTPAHNQLMVIGVGERLGVLLAAIYGAISVTAEFRYGTIRPTLLVAPRRWRIIAAKAAIAVVAGLILGLAATGLATVLGTSLLTARGVPVTVTDEEVRALIVGGSAAAALWGAIGVGVGALVRNQVPTMIGLAAWLLFIEGLLVEEASSFLQFGKFGPGAAATSMAGMGADAMLAPAVGLLVLVLYAALFTALGAFMTERRDVP